MSCVLVLGQGGREHALAWKLAQSPAVREVLVGPGNAGTMGGKLRSVPISLGVDGFVQVADLIRTQDVELTIVGPEVPLLDGIVDALHAKGITQVFGPQRAAAALEGDKFFSYSLLEDLGIPQARGRCCITRAEAIEAIEALWNERGVVLKARGLAAGKGVVMCSQREEAHAACEALSARYGSALLVSERLEGPEFSVFAICDGQRAVPWPMAFQDHKARDNGGRGPNTGGMGAYGPVSFAPAQLVHQVAEQMMSPVVEELARRGAPFHGFLFGGLMMTSEGPKMLEFNVRFGDPECQAAMMMCKSDLFEILCSALRGELRADSLHFHEGAACCVVLAAPGYPGVVQKGMPIEGVDIREQETPDIQVFHAGTSRDEKGTLVSAGGRILGVTARDRHGLSGAREKAYQKCAQIQMEGGFHFRSDIGTL
ncbi:MAG: phosphoribosylamine--glycine ligase [Myxococcota bacterium]